MNYVRTKYHAEEEVNTFIKSQKKIPGPGPKKDQGNPQKGNLK
jgi:hypothetical protein